MPKVGLKNLHVAKLISDDATGAKYDAIKKLAGAVQADIKPSSSSESFYSDDQIAETISTLGEIDVELEVGDLSTEMTAFLLGAKVNTDGVLEFSSNDLAPYVAIGFESQKSNGGSRLMYLYKGKFSLPDSSAKTKGDKVDFLTEKISGKFLARQFDGKWKAQLDSDDASVNKTVIDNWFKAVYQKTTTP